MCSVDRNTQNISGWWPHTKPSLSPSDCSEYILEYPILTLPTAYSEFMEITLMIHLLLIRTIYIFNLHNINFLQHDGQERRATCLVLWFFGMQRVTTTWNFIAVRTSSLASNNIKI